MLTEKNPRSAQESAQRDSGNSEGVGKMLTPPAFQLKASPAQADPKSSLPSVTSPGPKRCLQDGNDYFDEHGGYLYTDNTMENGIRVMPRSAWVVIQERYGAKLYDEENAHKDLMGDLKLWSDSLSNLHFETKEMKESVGRTMDFYLNLLGFQSSKSSAKIPGSDTLMQTGTDSGNYVQIFLSLSEENQVRFPQLADNKFNFMNTLVHEKCHADSHFEEIVSSNGEKKYESMGTEKETSVESCLRHLESYFAQMENETWAKTDIDYKIRRIQYAGAFMAFLKDHEIKGGGSGKIADHWISEFQSKFHFRFAAGMIYGDPDRIGVEFTK